MVRDKLWIGFIKHSADEIIAKHTLRSQNAAATQTEQTKDKNQGAVFFKFNAETFFILLIASNFGDKTTGEGGCFWLVLARFSVAAVRRGAGRGFGGLKSGG